MKNISVGPKKTLLVDLYCEVWMDT